mmetsp:Transcript_22366/g.42464  ORF Transcript_22366/g.42464 Transcript_22366/m.42464 type:complete len:952 (-) Transcript_22366:83-2938(-)
MSDNNNNHSRRSYSSRGSNQEHDYARRSSRNNGSNNMMDMSQLLEFQDPSSHSSASRRRHNNTGSAASVQSNDSGKFSETKLGQMLAQQGIKASSDFEVPVIGPAHSPKVNLVDRVAKRNKPPQSVMFQKQYPQTTQNRQQDFAQMLQAEPQQSAMPKPRAIPVYPTTLRLNDNLEIDMDAAGHHPTHDSGIILIHEDHPHPYPTADATPHEAVIEIPHRQHSDEDEPSAFDADDLYMTEFGGDGHPHHYRDDNFRDEYHDEDLRRRTTTCGGVGSAPYTDSVSTRSTRSLPWPARPDETPRDPYETRYRDNIMLGDEIEEFHALKREKLMFQKRRRSRFIWCLLLMCNVLLLAIVLPVFLLRGKDQDGGEGPTSGLSKPKDPVPTANVPKVPPTMATDSKFHSDWTQAGVGENVMRDYVLHPVASGENTASIIAPPGEDIFVYVMPQSTTTTTDDCTGWGDPFLQVPGGDMALVQVPNRDTQIVACTGDNHVVAAVHHIFVDAWLGEALDYQLQVMDWNLPDFHKNQINHVFEFEQRRDTDLLYMLFVLNPGSNNRVLFVDGPENVQQLRKALIDFPRKGHHCDGTGMEYSNPEAVWYVLAADTAVDEDLPGYILWDLTPMLSGNHVDSWSTLAWTCDETASTMQKPVVQVSVKHPGAADTVPVEPVDTPVVSTAVPTQSPTVSPIATPTTAPDASFQTDWSNAAQNPVNEYVLHGVPKVETIHEVTVVLNPSTEMVFELPQPEVITLNGPCNPRGDWGAVEMPTDGSTVRLSIHSRDVQVVSCSNGQVEASVTHVFVPSWAEDQEAHQMQILDFNTEGDFVQAHLEAHASDRLYLLMIPKAPYEDVLYVDGATVVAELQTVLSQNPNKIHTCDGTGNGFNNGDAVWYAEFETTVGGDAGSEPSKVPFRLWEVTEFLEGSENWSTLAWLCNMENGLMVKPVAQISVSILQ